MNDPAACAFLAAVLTSLKTVPFVAIYPYKKNILLNKNVFFVE